MSELKELVIVCDGCGDEARFSTHRDDVEVVGGAEAARRQLRELGWRARRQSGHHTTSFYGSRADYCSSCVREGRSR